MSASPSTARVRVEARVTGVVQGVGFRPFVYGLAREAGLDGWVLNDERGVLIEVEGESGEVERFLARVESEAPPLARVEGLSRRAIGPRGPRGGFTIEESGAGGEHGALVSADMATCADCLAEVLDPVDRRHRYPFTNCTNCGPRLTIVVDVPYDRPATTMASFEMCAALPGRVRGPRRSPLPRPAQRLPGLRPAAAPRRPRGRRGARRRRRARAHGERAARRADRRDQGRRRLPPRLPGGLRAGRGGAARAQAPRGQALRPDVRRPRRRPWADRAERRGRTAAGGARGADRDRAAPSRRRGRGERRARELSSSG